ncbi:hypothetical protein [Methanosalsum natronophilum]|uniref:hypothetical protein n=1 Tax=Methanosalsum natronophilum TaxID=768733 RepID=UPI00216A3AA0|nr:hypothetical protein [Methanosalsum natronophilum]MCS3924770.1 hypothetical protein [Methanosalsum natronophilum]
MRFKILTFLFVLVMFACPVSGSDGSGMEVRVDDLYSNIESGTIWIALSEYGEGLELKLELKKGDELLQTKTFDLDDYDVDARLGLSFDWSPGLTSDGGYAVYASIWDNDDKVASQRYGFVHGRPTLNLISINSINANSKDVSLILGVSPNAPSIADITYMLIDDNKIISTKKDEGVALSSSPMTINKQWDKILDNKKEYQAKVKIDTYSPVHRVTADQTTFVAKEDVMISDIFKDRRGSSITLEGKSQVPFNGIVRFTVTEFASNSNDEPIQVVEKRSPILLNEDDETIEAIWDESLQPGQYKLSVEAVSGTGEIIDSKETIIEVEERALPQPEPDNETDDDGSLTGISMVIALLVLTSIAIYMKKR